jgi:hypothetical protein
VTASILKKSTLGIGGFCLLIGDRVTFGAHSLELVRIAVRPDERDSAAMMD